MSLHFIITKFNAVEHDISLLFVSIMLQVSVLLTDHQLTYKLKYVCKLNINLRVHRF